MFRNYIKIAWRHLLRNKMSSIINVMGLALALAIAILIGLYIRHQMSYDNWLTTENSVYRVYRHWSGSSGGWVYTPKSLVNTFREEIPELSSATQITADQEMLLTVENKKLYAPATVFVDSSFFSTIPFLFLYGTSENALAVPNSIVLSEEMASKLFGNQDPIGEPLQLGGTEQKVVTGVLKKAGNTHLAKDVFVRNDFVNFEGWLSNNFATYVSLPSTINPASISEKITAIVNPRIQQAFEANGYAYGEENFSDWKLQPISDIHLYSRDFTWAQSSTADIRQLYIFGGIAIVLLLIAIFNYVNLTTAQSSLRAKEIGVRKVSGAFKGQLVGQFLTEATFQTFLAIFIGAGLALLFLPSFRNLLQINLDLAALNWSVIAILLVGGIFVGLLAGVYPAFVLSKFRPKRVLQLSQKGNKGFTLRKFLVVAQFSVVITMMIILGVMMQQVDYMLEEDLGFEGEQVLVVPTNDFYAAQRLERLRSEVLSVPGLREFGSSSAIPGEEADQYTLYLEGFDEPIGTKLLFADGSTLDTWKVNIKEGRNFSKERAGDSLNFLVNEAFVKRYQLKDPFQKNIKTFGDSTYRSIIGVIEDFHFESLDKVIEPLVISSTNYRTNVSFSVSTANLAASIQGLRNIWAQIEPEHPMRYSFLDENFAAQYQAQLRFRKGMTYATLLTILIAILGLFGLATFMIKGRVKEIGVRKVLGASAAQIVHHLNRDFLWLVVISIAVALPLGWYISNQWLQDFAYRISMPWWIFVLAALITVIVALLTVSVQSVKAAMMNPVDSLRSD